MMSDSWGVHMSIGSLFKIPSSSKGLKATIEHGHNNCLTLDLATVAYWYQDKATAVPAIPDKAGRKLKPMVNNVMIHKWRHEWRKNKGEQSGPLGDE